MLTSTNQIRVAPKIAVHSMESESKKIQRVLLMIDMTDFGIGDSVVSFTNLRALNLYLNNPSMDLYTNQYHYAILKNNPFVEKVFFAIDQIAFDSYDVILVFSDKEFQLKQYFENIFRFNNKKLEVYSLCGSSLAQPAFPYYEDFIKYTRNGYLQHRVIRGQEIYISSEEKAWAENWFKEMGVSESDKIVVLLDSSSGRHKLLNTDVFFGLVNYFKEFEDVKILIFEEKSAGKEKFYAEWLKEDLAGKFIFVRDSTLRKDICLLGSDLVKAVIGPCTGLMHCATGIYNTFRHNRKLFRDLPIMITYIGTQSVIGFEINAWDWWGESLVDCIYVSRDRTGRKLIKKLIGPFYNCLPCSEFTVDLLVDYFEKNYRHRFLTQGIHK